MYKPATDIGRTFAQKCDAINAHFAKSAIKDDRAFAHALTDYFDYFDELPEMVTQSESGYTALYEIDRALEGVYSDVSLRMQLERTLGARKIVVDYSALLQRFYLIAKVAQLDGQFGKLPGIDRFYERWGKDQSLPPYERACEDAEILLGQTDLGNEVRYYLASELGKIAITLGLNLDFIQGKIRSNADHIAARKSFGGKVLSGELLLNLQVLHTLQHDMTSAGIPVESLSKAIRYWSSCDTFLNYLFKLWKWNWENDYVSPISLGERSQLTSTSELYREWSEGRTNLGVGRSFLEQHKHRQEKPTELFQPIPIFILGRSNVGKSSFFTAMNYEMTNRSTSTSGKLAFGQQLAAYYDTSQKSWLEGQSVPTAAYSYFEFWRDVRLVGFCTYDYRGGDSEPQQWDPRLQEMFRNSRGIIFMIDEADLETPVKMRERAAWSGTILAYWRISNPMARHVPIAVVINKADLILPEAMPHIERTTLLSETFQAPLVENYAVSRFAVDLPECGTPLGRFEDCLLHDSANNIQPKLQDLTQQLIEHFDPLFSRILEITYHYQIFLMSSRAPQQGDAVAIPWAVQKPFLWMTEILQEEHIAETVEIYDAEVKTLEEEIKSLSQGVARLRSLQQGIAHQQDELQMMGEKAFVFDKERRMSNLEKNIGSAEAQFTKIAALFIETLPRMQNDVLTLFDRQIRDKSNLLENLKQRLKNYQARKERRLQL